MIKRRKDDGFTLIELMIVIAVIGILAVVLVPKVGGIKTAAKSAGIDTNMRTVQAYVQGKITSWDTAERVDNTFTEDDIISNLDATFPITEIVNPFDSTHSGFDAVTVAPETGIAGQIVAIVEDGTPLKITITAYDDKATLMPDKKIVINP